MKTTDATAPALDLPSRTTSPATASSPTAAASSRWNTKNLGLRLASDAVSAACAASLVAPVVTIIDRSIMENASGRQPLKESLKASLRTLVTRPHALFFSKPFALIFMLYGTTYLTANGVDTAHSTLGREPASAVTAGTTKFAASSATNIAACIYKDQVFVKLFGPPGAVARPVPLGSFALFAARDCLTIFASFNIPPLLGPYLSAHLSAGMQQYLSGVSAAQFLAPAAVQFVSTPLHLLGLDLYNRPTGTHLRDRWRMVRKNWPVSAAARICRIVPAFGVGGVVNTTVRRRLMETLE